jgi:hypothetical protein
VQRATEQSKTGKFCDYGLAEAPPGFQAGWSDCMSLLFSLFFPCFFLIWVFRVSSCTHDATVQYSSPAQMSSLEEIGVSFVALGILEPQTARH